jgi:hypothetical protein
MGPPGPPPQTRPQRPPIGWGPPPLPPPPLQDPAPPAGISENGLPNHQRGRVGFDTGGCLNTRGQSCGAFANLVATLPLTDALMFATTVPLSVGQEVAFGNPGIGAHYVGRVTKKLWITGGGELGIPLTPDPRTAPLPIIKAALPKALWDTHHYFPDIVPVRFLFALEYHASIVELRFELEPAVWAPVGNNDDVDGTFNHSAEIQLGHEIGGGVRLQGVVYGPTEENYQLALHPFFGIEKQLGYLRTGPMIPFIDGLGGPPFEESWGWLLETGIRID